MSELTREEKIEAEIKEAKKEKAKIEILIAEGIDKNDKELLLIRENRLSEIYKHIVMLHEHLENERQFQRNNATETKVFILIYLFFYIKKYYWLIFF